MPKFIIVHAINSQFPRFVNCDMVLRFEKLEKGTRCQFSDRYIDVVESFEDIISMISGDHVKKTDSGTGKPRIRIEDIEFSRRTGNCFHNAGIEYLDQIATQTEVGLLKSANFGRKSLNEVKEILEDEGYHLEMSKEEIDTIHDMPKHWRPFLMKKWRNR